MRKILLLTIFSAISAIAQSADLTLHVPLTRADSVRISENYFDLGYAEYLPGNLDSALAFFDRALLYDSLSAKAWHSRGATLARMNRHAEAQTAFDTALRLRPDYLSAWWHRGCDNAVSDRAEEALSDLRRTIALDSNAKRWPFEDPCWNSLLQDPRLQELTK